MKIDRLPKKMRVSTIGADGSMKTLGIMEQDGDKWFVTGKHKEGIKQLIGKRGKYFGGKMLTLKDRELCFPMMLGCSGLVVDVTEYEQDEEDDNQD